MEILYKGSAYSKGNVGEERTNDIIFSNILTTILPLQQPFFSSMSAVGPTG